MSERVHGESDLSECEWTFQDEGSLLSSFPSPHFRFSSFLWLKAFFFFRSYLRPSKFEGFEPLQCEQEGHH